MTGGITEAIGAKAGDRFIARYQSLVSLSLYDSPNIAEIFHAIANPTDTAKDREPPLKAALIRSVDARQLSTR